MSYAILRTAKLTTLGNVGGSAAHNFRERNTENADPDLTPENCTSGAQSAKEVIEAVKDRLSTVPTVRKNAVLAVEYFIGASPEWFKEQSTEVREAYFDQAEKWLKERHGAENVIAFTRQYDETSPHVCAYVVPIDPRGKLNCSHFLDGREKLSEMQTDFAEKVGKQFDLDRGIEGSKAKHTTIKQYYAKIQAPTPEIKTKVPEVPKATTSQKMIEALGVATDHSRAVARQDKAKQQQAAELRGLREAEQAKAKQYGVEKAANDAREARLRELRATATQVRGLPLESVLERLECQRDTADRHNWRTPIGRVTVDGSKFFAHDIDKGGGGAIDLVMAVEGTDYKGAVNRLSKDFGTGAVLAEHAAKLKPVIEDIAKAPPEPFKAPVAVPEHWPKVREYLTEIRRLSVDLVDRFHKVGKVYADKFKNCVFVLGSGEGVALRGTGDKPFHGVRGEKVPFVIEGRGDDQRVAFVESAIDALSLHEIGFTGRIVAMSGSSSALAKAEAESCREQGLEVVAAFDGDKAGEAMARNLGQPCKRLRPEGKDWNEDLRQLRATPAELELKRQAEQANDLSMGR
jgi:Plasmid recombination enzyme/Toprim-like